MKQKKIILVTTLVMLFFSLTVLTQNLPALSDAPAFNPEKDITFKIVQIPAKANPNEKIDIELEVNVPEGYHITSEMFGFDSKDKAFVVNEIKLPKGQKTIIGEVIGGKIPVKITLTIKKQLENYPYNITFQACSEGENPVCFPPVTLSGKFKLALEKTKATVNNEKQTMENKLINALNTNIFLALLLVFLGGIGASLTPCVYPVIPLTMAYVGARSDGSKVKGFTISLFLVLGIATTYSILGMVSAKTGAMFGSISQNPIFIIVLTMIFVAMGLSMFGYYDIQLPASVNNKLQVKKKGMLGAYLVGMGTGVLAAPCVGPIIVVLLSWVAQTGSMFKGFIFLFTFSLGMGVLFVLIGTFSGIMASLPKAGNWMIKVKYVFGILFFIAAVLFAKPVLGKFMYCFIILAALTFVVVLIFKNNIKIVSKKTGIALLILFAVVLSFPQFLNNKKTHSEGVATNYKNTITNTLNSAKKNNKLVILDFYADWCAACKELDEYTWENDKVKEILQLNYIMLKLDFTKTSKEGKELQRKYSVKGLPTVIFLDSNGKELTRFVGFVKAEKFLEISNKVIKTNE
jgi:thiol:disulfide interchange protein DsbD